MNKFEILDLIFAEYESGCTESFDRIHDELIDGRPKEDANRISDAMVDLARAEAEQAFYAGFETAKELLR